MAEIWGAIAAAVVGVGGSMVAANQAKKKAGATVPYDAINPQQQQYAALQGNIGAQDTIEALLKRSDAFAGDQALSLENKVNPNFAKLRGKLAETSSSLLDNPYELPKDVQDNLGRIAAERGISAGTRGQFNDFSLLRDFGINSLQYGQQRIGQAQGIAGLLSSISPKVNPMSPLGFYVSPSESTAAATNNNTNRQAIAQSSLNAQNAAAGAASDNLWSNLSKLAGAGLGAYMNKGSGSNNPPDSPPVYETDPYAIRTG